MDTFIEQIVQKKKGGKEWAVISAALFGVLAVVLLMLLFMQYLMILPILPILLFAGAVAGAWYLISGQNTEFEYCVTNGDIDIDTIIDRRRRKRIVSVSGRKIEALLPYEVGKSMAGYQRVVMAAPSLQEAGLWYFTYHSKKNGHTLVVFQPEQRVLQALYASVPKLVQMDTRRAAENGGIVLDARRSSHGSE